MSSIPSVGHCRRLARAVRRSALARAPQLRVLAPYAFRLEAHLWGGEDGCCSAGMSAPAFLLCFCGDVLLCGLRESSFPEGCRGHPPCAHSKSLCLFSCALHSLFDRGCVVLMLLLLDLLARSQHKKRIDAHAHTNLINLYGRTLCFSARRGCIFLTSTRHEFGTNSTRA